MITIFLLRGGLHNLTSMKLSRLSSLGSNFPASKFSTLTT
ncbi:hypothetical protein LINPERPRIM_LOCUS25752 [Linum perenne]